MTDICVSKLTVIGSGNGLSPGQCQSIIWTNAGIFLIGPLGTNFSNILSEIYAILFTKTDALECVVCEMSAILSGPQCVWRISPHVACVEELGQHCFVHVKARRLLAPSHYFNQCWLIVPLLNPLEKLENLNQASNIFIEGNVFDMLSAIIPPNCPGGDVL